VPHYVTVASKQLQLLYRLGVITETRNGQRWPNLLAHRGQASGGHRDDMSEVSTPPTSLPPETQLAWSVFETSAMIKIKQHKHSQIMHLCELCSDSILVENEASGQREYIKENNELILDGNATLDRFRAEDESKGFLSLAYLGSKSQNPSRRVWGVDTSRTLLQGAWKMGLRLIRSQIRLLSLE